MYPERPRSNFWFLLPIFLGLIGGIIAYFVLRQDDPKKAKNCLYLGIVLAIIGIMINIFVLRRFLNLSRVSTLTLSEIWPYLNNVKNSPYRY